ncbi:hypothetical protein [Nocardioides iriomotensis]|uniref:Sulfotransferase family protein n=1 Tax=Nocardioides iriomotensis TaxID=715784 RepID=A0A4Q5IYF7_9ACTN|nr:hypothetical protein [Nocardioides iriomotensis]RYU11162.1 hypothetical protein ETU37_14075 [Nocardioides iriomotensis]
MPEHPLPRTYVHIGLQKTGTSYLQSVFWKSRDALASQGLAMLPGSKRATFRVMLDVREREAGGLAALDTRLASLLAAAGQPGAPTRYLLTEESLAPATGEQVRRLVEHLAGTEVHVVLTVRDLARQVPSVWQQKVTARRRYTYEQYLDVVVGRRRRSRDFWASQDVPAVLERWTAAVPPERVHVVTVPPSGTDPAVLLSRFCQVLEVDPAALDTRVPRRNVSLGLVQTELLRRVNVELGGRLRKRQAYRAAGKMYLGKRILSAQGGTPALMPRRLDGWARGVTDEHLAALRSGGYDVVGTLDDLVPVPASYTDDAQTVTDADVAAAAAKAMATMLVQPRRERRRRKRRPRRPAPPPSLWRRALRRLR